MFIGANPQLQIYLRFTVKDGDAQCFGDRRFILMQFLDSVFGDKQVVLFSFVFLRERVRRIAKNLVNCLS